MESGLGASTESCLAFDSAGTSWRGKCIVQRTGYSMGGGKRERRRERLQGKLQLHNSLYLNVIYCILHQICDHPIKADLLA